MRIAIPRLCQKRGTGTSHLSVIDEFHAPLFGASPPFLTKPSILAILTTLAIVSSISAQSFRRGGTELNAKRAIVLPDDQHYSILVIQFFHHGEIDPNGQNVLVSTREGGLVPTRVLQLGPGDYCRLAFQTLNRATRYEVFYGGDPPETDKRPEWTAQEGLLLETRRYQDCNLNRLESVRDAFESSERIGSDYVENVRHSHNPFQRKPGPFLSKYSGTLHIATTGKYGFLTSSQDCSFLLIDGKEVVSAPGRHRPLYRATPGTRQDITLSAGVHKFEYYHAASGQAAMMVAAWEIAPSAEKPQPSVIPTEQFRTTSVGRAEVEPVSTRTQKLVPDFQIKIDGDVPLPENDEALIGVQFANFSPSGLTLMSKIRWEFGDGQSSEAPEPMHVYLRPGLYEVKLIIKRGPRTLQTVNRLQIDRPMILRNAKKETLHQLDQYLPILDSYDPTTLDAASLLQLVRAYRWKADLLLAPPEPEDSTEPASNATFSSDVLPSEANRTEANKYIRKAVTAGSAAFLSETATPALSKTESDVVLIDLIRRIGTMARDELGDSALAAKLWFAAARKIDDADRKTECELEAADIAINDLLNEKAAKTLLDAATKRLGKASVGAVAARLHRIQGDYFASTGKGPEARKAYAKAQSLIDSKRTQIARTAWRGAHGRSTEEFLKTRQFPRASTELRAWTEEFPDANLNGYITLLHARYWKGREKYAQAIALSERLLTVHPDSPYIDQLLLLAADCEVRQGHVDRALATLNSLVQDYPGSPLVPIVKKNIAALESGEVKLPKPKRSRP